MKKILALIATTLVLTQPARADNAQVFGAVVGAWIGYEIMSQRQEPQIIYRPQPQVVIVQQPHYHRIHPQTARIYRDTCTVYGYGRHGEVICR